MGLAVAILILKSAVELGIETLRSLREGETDLSRYKIGLLERYEQFRQAQLRDWMLYLADQEQLTRADLIARVREALDFSGNPALRGFGLDRAADADELTDQSLRQLYEREWLLGEARLRVTDSGREHLRRAMKKTRGDRHRLGAGGQGPRRERRVQ